MGIFDKAKIAIANTEDTIATIKDAIKHDLDNIIADSKQITTANLKYLLNDIYTMVTVFHYENTLQGMNRENVLKLRTIKEAIDKERSLMTQVMTSAIKEANKDEYKNWPEQRARILEKAHDSAFDKVLHDFLKRDHTFDEMLFGGKMEHHVQNIYTAFNKIYKTNADVISRNGDKVVHLTTNNIIIDQRLDIAISSILSGWNQIHSKTLDLIFKSNTPTYEDIFKKLLKLARASVNSHNAPLTDHQLEAFYQICNGFVYLIKILNQLSTDKIYISANEIVTKSAHKSPETIIKEVTRRNSFDGQKTYLIPITQTGGKIKYINSHTFKIILWCIIIILLITSVVLMFDNNENYKYILGTASILVIVSFVDKIVKLF